MPRSRFRCTNSPRTRASRFSRKAGGNSNCNSFVQIFHDLRFLRPFDLVLLFVLEIVFDEVPQIVQRLSGTSLAANASSNAGRTFCLISRTVTL